MTHPAAEILTELQQRGVLVVVDGDRLCLKPRHAMDDALLARVREAKPAILEPCGTGRPRVPQTATRLSQESGFTGPGPDAQQSNRSGVNRNTALRCRAGTVRAKNMPLHYLLAGKSREQCHLRRNRAAYELDSMNAVCEA